MNFDLLLNNIRKHISLTTEETIFFTSLLQPKSLAKGDFLLREGAICKYDSFVVKGCLKTYYQFENGTEQIIDFLIEEWWANDLYSLFTQTASKSNIKAIEDTQLLQVSAVDLEILYQKIPKFERFFRLLFQKAYIAQREQINAGLSITAEERYRLFIQKKPYAKSRFTQKDIAAYLGITPQFLSVLKKKLHPVKVD
jgi:CRP-like cAMP-binding protein